MKLQSRFFLSNTKELEKKFGKGEKLRLQTHLSVYKGKGLDRWSGRRNKAWRRISKGMNLMKLFLRYNKGGMIADLTGQTRWARLIESAVPTCVQDF